jgi:deoxycytidylate deaminase
VNAKYSPEQLIARDEREEHIKDGQDVRDTFHRADCSVRVDKDLPTRMRRVLDILFNDPVRSPTRDEFATFQAVAAARRSAELGRQVGAAICTAEGDVVAVGVNEVPHAAVGSIGKGIAATDVR